MIKLTPDMVSRLWWRMLLNHPVVKVVAKGDSELMRNVGAFLSAVGIMNARDFMQRYATTIATTIYLPFVPGVETEEHSLLSQASTCPHEFRHTVQYRRAPVTFLWGYTSSSMKRAMYEADCYAHNMELRHWLTGERPDPAGCADNLKAYACNASSRAAARAYLESVAPTIMGGGISRTIVKEAVAILSEQ